MPIKLPSVYQIGTRVSSVATGKWGTVVKHVGYGQTSDLKETQEILEVKWDNGRVTVTTGRFLRVAG